MEHSQRRTGESPRQTTFDEALAIIAGWVGTTVSVDLTDDASGSHLASLEGAMDIPVEATGDADPAQQRWVVRLGGNPRCVFSLDCVGFHEADGDAHGLRVRIGGCTIDIGRVT